MDRARRTGVAKLPTHQRGALSDFGMQASVRLRALILREAASRLASISHAGPAEQSMEPRADSAVVQRDAYAEKRRIPHMLSRRASRMLREAFAAGYERHPAKAMRSAMQAVVSTANRVHRLSCNRPAMIRAFIDWARIGRNLQASGFRGLVRCLHQALACARTKLACNRCSDRICSPSVHCNQVTEVAVEDVCPDFPVGA